MHPLRFAVLACFPVIAGGPALAQSADTAAERARLGEQRIRIEAERRAQEENERQQQTADPRSADAEDLPTGTAIAKVEPEPDLSDQPVLQNIPDESVPPSAATRDLTSEEVSRALDQLRALGELKDAGYLTDGEFARIKERILESQF